MNKKISFSDRDSQRILARACSQFVEVCCLDDVKFRDFNVSAFLRSIRLLLRPFQDKLYPARKLMIENLYNKGIYRRSRFLASLAIKVLKLNIVNPDVVVCAIDNSELYIYLDWVVHKNTRFVTVQNANRWHDSNLDNAFYLGFFVKPLFRSDFGVLGAIDREMHEAAGWYLGRCRTVGNVVGLPNGPSGLGGNLFSICVIANSNAKRSTMHIVARYLRAYSSARDVSICIALKRSVVSVVEDIGVFEESYREWFELFGDFALLVPNQFGGVWVGMHSEITIGHYSTSLRTLIGLGRRVLPFNFDAPEVDSYFSPLEFTLRPTERQFFELLDATLKMTDRQYYRQYCTAIQRLGAVVDPNNPFGAFRQWIGE